MKEVNSIQNLLRRQKAYMNGILVMQRKLFDIQNQIDELIFKEIKKEKNQQKISSDLMSAKDVCSQLEISSSTLYRMRVHNNFPFVKIKGRKTVMFKKQDVDKYLENLKNKQDD